MPVTLAIALYSISWIILIRAIRTRQATADTSFRVALALGLVAHLVGGYMQIYTPQGLNLSFFKVGILFFWVLNLLILLSSLRKPLHNLFAILLPATVLTLLASLYAPSETSKLVRLSPGLSAHVAISLIAYGILTMATVQALILAYQDRQIRNKHPGGMIRLLPPLQTMEKLFFELLWAGEIFLTLVILSGAFFVEDMMAQHLAHKTVLTVLAWIIYGILLWGRHQMGWRGSTAVRWALSGFGFLLLAYFGSKLVLELILGRA